MNEADKKAVEQLKGKGKSTSSEENSVTPIKEHLEQIGEELGDSWTDYVQFQAWQRLTANLRTGYASTEVGELIAGIKYGVRRAVAATKAELAGEVDPKYLLPSSSELSNTSNEDLWVETESQSDDLDE